MKSRLERLTHVVKEKDLVPRSRGVGTKVVVSSLTAAGATTGEYDPGGWVEPLVIYTRGGNGELLEGEVLHYEVIAGLETGSGFEMEDGTGPLRDSWGVSNSVGGALPVDSFRCGSVPGDVTIRVTAPYSEGSAVAEFQATVTSRPPHHLEIMDVSPGPLSANSVHTPSAAVRVVASDGKPVTYGQVEFRLWDPENSGTIMIFGGAEAVWGRVPVDELGEMLAMSTVVTGVAGKTFYLSLTRPGMPGVEAVLAPYQIS